MKRAGKPKGELLLLLVLVLLWTALIWSNSAKPAAESAGQSLQVLAQVKGILLGLGFDEEVLHVLVRKSAHVIEFAVLGGLWISLAGQRWRGDRKFARLLAFTLSLMTALVDETIQLSFEGRAGMIMDLWVDLFGVTLGMFFASVLLVLKRRHKT